MAASEKPSAPRLKVWLLLALWIGGVCIIATPSAMALTVILPEKTKPSLVIDPDAALSTTAPLSIFPADWPEEPEVQVIHQALPSPFLSKCSSAQILLKKLPNPKLILIALKSMGKAMISTWDDPELSFIGIGIGVNGMRMLNRDL